MQTLNLSDLKYVRGFFTCNFVFYLIAQGSVIQGLANFDQIIQGLNEKVEIGTTCRIDLVDWVDEDAQLGSISILKQNDSTLIIQAMDVQKATKIRSSIALDIKTALGTFYEVK